ncbi:MULTISPECIES: hypothetical protein [Stenotrophomonas]|uniref:hypothetical protein n=1 Tax=Stenotrophomonas TaxID=40323 RepID=UPI00066E33EB|nr:MULTISPECIES: hypothetical protein [Stenotrophomonas]EKT4100060.1 hypothetical protein [Stenotrophomonas maltophilia]ELC7321857.1 hypothetical protein [Stenotrophomonas maltophilia]MBA0362896.1 hypothetical protein [Stenotrophomonas maltophilia]MBH1667361.1 hypothetical protein [Stenotrophomonas maltophilia]MBH1731951.1 hypothetical protein [Stenotrophomonas maltophilia]
MKHWTGGIFAVALMVSAGVQAQEAKGLLRQIGQAISGTPRTVSERARSPYLEPAGTYWDDGDPPMLDGYTRIRWGLAATASAGFGMCEDNLFAQAKAGAALTPAMRTHCIGSWGHQFKRVGLQGDPASAFEAKARQIASTDAFYLRPYIDVEIDPSTNILHAYVLVMNHDWYPRSPDFLPTAVIGPSPLGKGSAVVGVEHGGRYHAALRLKPEDAAELRRVGRDATGDRIFFKVVEGRLKPNGLPDIVLQIDRLEIGYKNQIIGITPSKDKDA